MAEDEPREIELKFRLDPARAGKVFEALGGGKTAAKTKALTAIYYDTPGRALAQAGLALRVRRENDVWVQTLKSAATADGHMGRGEWEAEVTGATPDLDQLADTPARAVLAKAKGLAPLFTVRVDRRIRVVRSGGAEIELSLDCGEIAAEGRVEALVELEMELKHGSPAALLGYAARARKAQGLSLSFQTKAARGMALLTRAHDRSIKFRTPRLSPDMTVGGAFKVIARACLEQIVGNAERLAQSPGPEIVHQMRVGARRLRSTLSIFGKVVKDRRLPAIKAELKWLTGELDTARNLDVLLAGAWRRAASGRRDDRKGLADLGRNLRIARGAAYARARSAAESERLADLVMDTLTWIESGAWTAGGAAGAARRERRLARFAVKALGDRWRKLTDGGRDLRRLTPEQRHHLRIDAKKLRYAADVFAVIAPHPKRAERFIDALRELQDALGGLNDIVTGEHLAHDLVALPTATAEADWTAGRIIGEEAGREDALLKDARTALKKLAKAEAFWG